MKKSILLALVAILFMAVGYGDAADVTLLGPNQYTRTDGTPNVYTDTFPARIGIGRIFVQNGGVDGIDLVSGAIVKVNGKEVFGVNDFNQRVLTLDAQIELGESNSLSIELRSKPGTYIIVKLVQSIAPEVEAVIGHAGGTLVVDNENSRIDGVRIDVPEGAISQDTTLSIILNPVHPDPLGEPFVQRTPVIEFVSSRPGMTFNTPVTISIPIEIFEAESPVLPLVAFFNEETGAWQFIPAFSDDTSAAVVFETTHFSFYQLINFLLDPPMFSAFMQETSAYLALREMAEKANTQALTCADWAHFSDLCGVLERASFEMINGYIRNHDRCLFGESPEEFVQSIVHQLERAITTKLTVASSRIILEKILLLSSRSSPVLIVRYLGTVGAILATPQLVCVAATSTLNTDLWVQVGIYHLSRWGRAIAELRANELKCYDEAENLIPNASFEYGSELTPDGWEGARPGAFYEDISITGLSWTTAIAREGLHSIEIIGDDSQVSYGIRTKDWVPFDPTKRYLFGYWVHWNSGYPPSTLGFYMLFEAMDSRGEYLGGLYAFPAISPGLPQEGWQFFSEEIPSWAVPPGTTWFKLLIYNNGIPHKAYVDSLSLKVIR